MADIYVAEQLSQTYGVTNYCKQSHLLLLFVLFSFVHLVFLTAETHLVSPNYRILAQNY
jgi:hypothetical protein